MTSTAGAAAPDGGPVDPRRRIEAVDMVRGFALFGVLLVNMFNFGAFSPVWTGTADRVAFAVMHVFFETKAWRLFALLFGLGFSLQLVRAEQRGERFVPTYLRRLLVLFLIGVAHALLFAADVLTIYAELGVALLLLRRASPRALLVASVALLCLFPLGRAANAAFGEAHAPAAAATPAQARAVNEELATTHPYAVGSFSDVVRTNARLIPANPLGRPLGAESGIGFLAMFLLGLCLGKLGVVSDLERHAGLVRRGAAWGLSIGLLAMLTEQVIETMASGAGNLASRPVLGLIRDLSFTLGSTALCLGYASAIALLATSAGRRWLVAPFGPVGRLALTVYLTQTLAFTTLFYGYGLGQAFRMGPAWVTLCALAIYGVQMVACARWVRAFRYGPVEWLWRAATYLRLPPMRAGARR